MKCGDSVVLAGIIDQERAAVIENLTDRQLL